MKRIADPKSPEHALKCQLATEVLRSFGILRLSVTGFSMLPAIWPGDMLVIDRCDSPQVSCGDIVLFGREDKLFAHRVVRKIGNAGDSRFITQGDGMSVPDLPVYGTEILGKVRQILRNGEYVDSLVDHSFRGRCIAKLVRHSTWTARLLVRLRSHDIRRQEAFCQN